jgi:DNA repair exonuclease SbcCD ATPase subunit
MARGDKPAPFGITPELRDAVYLHNWHDLFVKNNSSKQTELQVAINRHRNAWEKWTEAKATLKSTRDAWQSAFDVFRKSLDDLHLQEQTLTDDQAKAFTAGDMVAAKTAFDSLQEVRGKIRELEAPTDKSVTPAEAAKQAAQKLWKQAQVAEATARSEHLVTLATLLSLAEPLDEKAAKEYTRVVKAAPDKIIPALTEADGTVEEGRFSVGISLDEDEDTGSKGTPAT